MEGKADRTEIYRATDELFQTYRDTLCSYVIDLEIVTEQASKFDADEWLQLFEEMRTESPFVWINTLRFIEKNQAVSDKWYQGQFLADELDASLAELMEDETFFKTIEPLYFHAGLRRYLAEIDSEKKAVLLKEAVKRLGEVYHEVEEADR